MLDAVVGKPAKITIKTEYVFDGVVEEITPSHHVIRKHNGTTKTVHNDRVVSVECRQMERVISKM